VAGVVGEIFLDFKGGGGGEMMTGHNTGCVSFMEGIKGDVPSSDSV
jgi:hypothetical protein